MSRYRTRMRILLLTFVLGLTAAEAYERWMVIPVDLPVIKSENPLYVEPRLAADIPRGGGGSGGREVDEKISRSLENIDLRGTRIRDADFANAYIESAEFGDADLRNADFSGAVIWYSGFVGANLTDGNFTNAKLTASDLTGAVLVRTKFRRANLSRSDFADALVSSADFTDANLSDARLENVRLLTYAQIKDAIINENTSLPSNLLSKRELLIERSKRRAAELRGDLIQADAEKYFNDFDFLD